MNQELKNKIGKFLVDNNIIFEVQRECIAIDRYSIDRYSILGHCYDTGNIVLNNSKESYDLFFEMLSKEVGETVGYPLYDNDFIYCTEVGVAIINL